ncbi:MAG: pseudaminic acid biosynthesis-associated methylase [Cyanobacteria bacterium P01_E01_bin.42]
MREKTEQELFWQGEFGDRYTSRNDINPQLRISFFATVLKNTYGIQNICELGCNRGHNLEAIYRLSPNFNLTGIEINSEAIDILKDNPNIQTIHSSIQDFAPNKKFDLVFSCGVLIHIHPNDLRSIYQKMYEISSRYILLNEYYNPAPVEINYRGHSQKLFKRDFAGEFLDLYSNISVVTYGFLWQRLNPAWDDTTWFLLEKTE